VRTAETITVGSELTRGLSVDTHSALLARALEGCGLRVRFQTSVGDVLDEIAEAVAAALKRADCVVVTGGLGPTLDDVTREAVAAATGRRLHEDAALWAGIQSRFAASGRVATDNNRRQAAVVEGSVVLPNPLGTAPGLRLDLDGHALFALPGPPGELDALLKASVLPWLLERRGAHSARRLLQVYGLGESAVDAALQGLVPEGDSTSLAMLAKGSYVEIILSALDQDAALAEARVEVLEGEVLGVLGERVYSLDGRDLAEVVIGLLKDQRLTLAVAESCTGGGVAARLCAVPGASDVFWGGVVAYANELKELLLEVPPFVLKKAGAVSKDCALAMAVGLARKLDADYSLAVTGIAGPGGGSPEKPVGTVHLALAGPAGVTHQVCHFLNSDRKGVQARAAQAALWLVYASLAGLDVAEEGTDRGSLLGSGPASGHG
jgi:competence/damage-inducible protein CinA-like protein